MSTKIECSRCILDSEIPGIKIGEDKICSQCKEFDRVWGDWFHKEDDRRAALDRIVMWVRRKKRIYDCVVPLSGGKDSTYVLYYARKVLNLKCLAVTFDNGLLSDHARQNISNACKKLEVDHLYYGLDRSLLFQLYRYFFLKSGFFCPVCMRGIQVVISRVQAGFGVPLAMRGTCRRTEEYISPEFFISGDLGFIESVLEGNPLRDEAEVLLRPVGIFHSPRQIMLPNFIDWNYDTIFRTITEELGWNCSTPEAEHADCQASDVVHYFRWRKFPALVPERLRYSKLVTAGIMSRQEAQSRIKRNFNGEDPPTLEWFMDSLKITRKQIDEVLSSPFRHLQYLTKNRSRVKRRLISLKKRILT